MQHVASSLRFWQAVQADMETLDSRIPVPRSSPLIEFYGQTSPADRPVQLVQAEMETPDFMVALRAQLESAASESGSGKSGSNSQSNSTGADSSAIRCAPNYRTRKTLLLKAQKPSS